MPRRQHELLFELVSPLHRGICLLSILIINLGFELGQDDANPRPE